MTSSCVTRRNRAIEEVFRGGDGSRNRRLGLFSLPFSVRPREKRTECTQKCAQKRVPTRVVSRRYKALLWLSVKGHGLNAGRPHRFAVDRVRVSVFVTVYLQVRGEVAERLKAAVC